MKRVFEFIEFASIVLTEPQSISVTTRGLPSRDLYAMVCSGLASLSLATGVFYSRDSYSLRYLFLIPLLAVLVFFFHRFYSRLMAARLLQRMMSTASDTSGMNSVSAMLITVLESSFLPGLFILPVCITAREFTAPALLLVPGFIAVTFWILFIQYSGIRLIMETNPRNTVMLLVRNHLIMTIYPVLAIYVAMLLLISFTGIRGFG